MDRQTLITITDHETKELARCANAMYARGRNAEGHRMSALSALPRGSQIPVGIYDDQMRIYRDWMVFDGPK